MSATNSEVLAAIHARRSAKQNSLNAWFFLAGSLILFVGAGAFQWSVEFAVMLVVAIFIHELGHLLAMKIFRYKNLKMLFLPFVGGVAIGEPQEQNAYKIAMISIMGPLVGLLSCYAAMAAWLATRDPVFQRFAMLSLFLNAFNLLPILPLDGGHVLNESIFSRYPLAELIFKVLAVVGLVCLAFALESVIFGVIAVFLLITIAPSFRTARIAKRLRGEGLGGELTEEKVGRLRDELRAVNPLFESEKYQKSLPNVVSGLWLRIDKIYPSTAVTVGLVALYLGVAIVLPLFTYGFLSAVQIGLEAP